MGVCSHRVINVKMFLAPSELYKGKCRSVRPSVRPSVGPYHFCRVDFQVYLVLISDCNSLVYSLLSECPVTCDLGLSSVYLGLAESSFGLTLPIFPTIIFYLCFNLCLTLCLTYFTYILTYVLLIFNLCFDEAHLSNLSNLFDHFL